MMDVAASVIVRARNEEQQIARAMASIRSQMIPVEIVVVDPGSGDRTVAIAEHWCDRLGEILPESFAYGHALNIGAQESSAPIHVALSAHCALTRARTDWVERAITLYERPEIAAVTGCLPPRGLRSIWACLSSNARRTWPRIHCGASPITHRRGAPRCGSAIHSIRRWKRPRTRNGPCAFSGPDSRSPTSPSSTSTCRTSGPQGALALFRRGRLERRAMRSFLALDPYSLRDAAREWWTEMPDDRHSPFAHRFLNRRRLAGLAGTYVGDREAERSRGSD